MSDSSGDFYPILAEFTLARRCRIRRVGGVHFITPADAKGCRGALTLRYANHVEALRNRENPNVNGEGT